MPNHYHLQIETPRLNLSEAMRWLNISYAVWFNRKTRRNGPLFHGGSRPWYMIRVKQAGLFTNISTLILCE
jgi:putative transposase